MLAVKNRLQIISELDNKWKWILHIFTRYYIFSPIKLTEHKIEIEIYLTDWSKHNKVDISQEQYVSKKSSTNF